MENKLKFEGKRKGILITSDAAIAVLLALIIFSLTLQITAISRQSNYDMLALTREARDIYDVNYLSPIGSGGSYPLPDCLGKQTVAVVRSYVYVPGEGSASGHIDIVETKACR
ncbi:MAG: hypothetical protein V1911_04085 [Candidatus Micrarchaeota archaeon]